MTDEKNEPRQDPQIVVDDDWKSRVAAEKATERAAARRAARQKPPDDHDHDGQIPQASFEILVSTYGTQALVSLGLVPDPLTGKPAVNKPLAKHLIDMLGVIETVSRGNLTADQSGMLGGMLHQLRMAFLSVPESGSAEPETDPPPPKSILELP